MTQLDIAALSDFIVEAAGLMEQNKDYLIELDAAMGDGDLGLTMTAGFGKAREFVASAHETDVGRLLMKIGMTFAQAVPSTMGTLIASGFMKAAKAVMGNTALDVAGTATFAEGFVNGIMERGKGKPGDRTIIDSLYPAAQALRAAADAGKSLVEGCADAQQAAEQGVEQTKQMMPQFGRAVYFGEKALGRPDQGAIVGALFYQALHTTVARG